MSSGGRGSVGFCGTTKNRIDSSASYTADYSGVGRRRPNAAAVPCKSPDTGEDGWCWRNELLSDKRVAVVCHPRIKAEMLVGATERGSSLAMVAFAREIPMAVSLIVAGQLA
jgi:hypothetical protein